MEAETFFIRSVAIQNLIMGVVSVIVAWLLIRAVVRRNLPHVAAVVIWALIALWFFNGPLWGFSAITVRPDGLKLHYGFLSVFRNASLPPDTSWRIRMYMGGLKRTARLYYLELAGHKSLKVQGPDRLETLKAIGAAIDRLNNRPMGGLDNRPVNR